MDKRKVKQKRISVNKKTAVGLAGFVVVCLAILTSTWRALNAASSHTLPAMQTTQWAPYSEWAITNPSYSGNPYDLTATATFIHGSSGETRTTEMFYDGNNVWKFRFAGTQPGDWTFTTSSSDPELNGHSGLVTVHPNPGVPGFVTGFGDKWGRTGTNEAFVPQLAMAAAPHYYYNNPARIDADIQTFLVEHGFNGLHVPVFCRWVDLERPKCAQNGSADPDPRTFEALEQIITRVHAAGGVVHLWMWSDNTDQGNPNYLPGGINGSADVRIQRYLAARLGALPGWTLGYGFDLFEWVNESQLTTWHGNMHAFLGWDHYLGARGDKNQLTQLSEAMDYASYEQHKPNYDMYVRTISQRPFKPSFSEDRFRIRDEGRAKDYTMEETRRGLWHSAMAGGVANIWGNLLGASGANDGLEPSRPYPNPEWIKTYARFFDGRFLVDLARCNDLTSGACLKTPANAHYIFYQEETASIQMNLSGMAGSLPAVAVDAKRPYAEINLGQLSATNQTWTAPYASDWAIAVGSFGAAPAPQPPATLPPPTATAPPPQPTATATALPPQPTATMSPPQPPATLPPPEPTTAPNVCGAKVILFVGHSDPPLAEDQRIIDHLTGIGYQIVIRDQRSVRPEDLSGKDLIVVSDTISARRLSSTFRDVPVPVLTWESMIFDGMRLTEGGRRGMGYDQQQTRLNVVGGNHPMTAGLTGVVTTLNPPQLVYWGLPTGSADVVATGDTPEKAYIFAYEQGDALNGMSAPARRVAFYNGAGLFTPEGWQLFEAAVSWTAGCNP